MPRRFWDFSTRVTEETGGESLVLINGVFLRDASYSAKNIIGLLCEKIGQGRLKLHATIMISVSPDGVVLPYATKLLLREGALDIKNLKRSFLSSTQIPAGVYFGLKESWHLWRLQRTDMINGLSLYVMAEENEAGYERFLRWSLSREGSLAVEALLSRMVSQFWW